MKDEDIKGIFPILRRLAMTISENKGFSNLEIQRAKSLATKLYLLHTNRKIALSGDEFNILLSIIEYDFKKFDN